MFRTHKIFSLALVSLAFLSPGCDDDVDLESDEQEIQAAIDDEAPSAARSDAEPADEESEEFSEELPDERTAEIHPTAAPHCTGYDNGGNYCLAECWNTYKIHILGHKSVIPYGQCKDYAKTFCNNGRGGLYHHCWGKL